LVKEGLVGLDREEVRQGRLRRYLALTGSGQRYLAAETERMAANAPVVLRSWPAWRRLPTTATAPLARA
jgi:DNA-binding PadR family transcriptional regulator